MGLEDNKAVMRRWLEEGWSRGHLEAADELVAEDFIVHGAGGQVIPSGNQGVKELVRTWRQAFPDGRMQVLDDLAEGELVGVRLLWTGTHLGEFYGVPPSGRKVSCVSIGVDRVHDGKIAEGWGELDMLGLMQQIGALPSLDLGLQGAPLPLPARQSHTGQRQTGQRQTEEGKAVGLRFTQAAADLDLDAMRASCDVARYREHDVARGTLGLDAAMQTCAMLRAALPDLTFTPDLGLMVGEGDRMVIRGTFTGTHTGSALFGVPASGKRLEWTTLDLLRVTGGRVTERWPCADTLRLVQQLGLASGQQPTPKE